MIAQISFRMLAKSDNKELKHQIQTKHNNRSRCRVKTSAAGTSTPRKY